MSIVTRYSMSRQTVITFDRSTTGYGEILYAILPRGIDRLASFTHAWGASVVEGVMLRSGFGFRQCHVDRYHLIGSRHSANDARLSYKCCGVRMSVRRGGMNLASPMSYWRTSDDLLPR